MATRVLKFYIPSYGESLEDADEHEFKSPFTEDIEYMAEQYADYYHTHRDGWEATWPIEFYVADDKDNFLGVYSVDRESTPVFRARKTEVRP